MIKTDHGQTFSALAGFLDPRGASAILDHVNDNLYMPKASVYDFYKLTYKSFDITREVFDNMINKDILAKTNATHVLTSITFGLRMSLVIQNIKIDRRNYKARQRDLALVTRIVEKYGQSGSVVPDDLKYLDDSEIHFNATLFTDNTSPRSIKLIEAAKLYRYYNLEGFYNVTGVPIKFILTDLEWVMKSYKINWVNSGKLIDELPIIDYQLRDWVNYFEDLNQYECHINGIDFCANLYKQYLQDKDMDHITKVKQDLDELKKRVQSDLGSALIKVRFSDEPKRYLDMLLVSARNDNFSVDRHKLNRFIKVNFGVILKEMDHLDDLMKHNITIIPVNTKLETFIQENKAFKMILLLVYNPQSLNYVTINTFYKMVSLTHVHDGQHTLYCAANSKVVWPQSKSITKIILFVDGVLTIDDYQSIYDVQSQIENMTKPIGLVYWQLDDDQDQPSQVWPNNHWTDISPQYSGLFFRVVGGQSRGFGQTQDESFPMLNAVETVMRGQNREDIEVKSRVDLPLGQWSDYVITGGHMFPMLRTGIAFLGTDDEVRPRSRNIRLWKCSSKHSFVIWTEDRLKELVRESGNILIIISCYFC